LWADLNYVRGDKTRVYLERSKSSPINLSLSRHSRLSPHDHLFHITPHVIRRLKSLAVWGTMGNLQDITTQLTHPAPLLGYLSIIVNHKSEPERIPTLESAILDGDLSSLRKLCLEYVRT